jgi:transcriptional regulator with XRE-family HTH domain
MINRAIKVIRQFHNIKQIDLADELGISKSYLSELESGRKPVSIEILNKYSERFEIPVSSLLFFSENMNAKNSVPEKFKAVFTDKILRVMEWFSEQHETKKIKA